MELIGCWRLKSWQHLRPFEEAYWLVTVCTHSDFIVLLHWDQAANTLTWYPTQLHYPDSEPISPFPILIMLKTWLGNNKYQIKSYWFDSTRVESRKVRISLNGRRTRSLLIWPPHLVRLSLDKSLLTEIPGSFTLCFTHLWELHWDEYSVRLIEQSARHKGQVYITINDM